MNFVAWEPELPLKEIRAPFPIDSNHSIWQAFRNEYSPPIGASWHSVPARGFLHFFGA